MEETDQATEQRLLGAGEVRSDEQVVRSPSARVTHRQVLEHLRRAPPQVRAYDADPQLLAELALMYSEVTGRPDSRVTERMQRFLAACYRTHGDDTGPLLRALFAEGGEQNLLLRLRMQPRRDRRQDVSVRDVSDLLVGLDRADSAEGSGEVWDLPVEEDYPRSAWEISVPATR